MGAELAPRDLFRHYPHYHKAPGNVRPSSTIWRGQWKVIENLEDGRLELSNLAEDPYELKNLVTEAPAKAKELQQALKEWPERVGAQVPERL